MNKETEIMIFCENIKSIRKTNKLSKKEMAKLIDIGTKSLTLIENGRLPPKLGCDVLFEIQKEFGIAPKTMFSKNMQ
jgi:DNA-binding XRE family transcriptional regulator